MMLIKQLRTRGFCTLLACSLASPSVYASAPDAQSKPSSEVDQARLRFERGVELYDSGDVRAAYIEFKRAYALVPNYQLLFNIAQAQAELKDYVGAEESLSQYIEQAKDEISPERKEEVLSEMKRLRTYIAYVKINISVEGATVRVDGVVVDAQGSSSRIPVSAGRRKIEIVRKGYERWERSIDVAGEDVLTLDAMLVREPSAQSKQLVSPSSAKPRQLRESKPAITQGPPSKKVGPLFWTGVVATSAFGVTSAILGGVALRARSEHQRTLGTAPTPLEKLQESGHSVKRLALATDIGLILTASSAAFTVAAYFWEGKKSKKYRYEPKRLGASVAPGGLVLHGRF